MGAAFFATPYLRVWDVLPHPHLDDVIWVGAAGPEKSTADLEVMAKPVRAMFDAYAAGVNAFLRSGCELPPEYALTGISPEPWEVWQSLAVFKIRHILMGTWQWNSISQPSPIFASCLHYGNTKIIQRT